MAEDFLCGGTGRAVTVFCTRFFDFSGMGFHVLCRLGTKEGNAMLGLSKVNQPVNGHDILFKLGQKQFGLLLLCVGSERIQPLLGGLLCLAAAAWGLHQLLGQAHDFVKYL